MVWKKKVNLVLFLICLVHALYGQDSLWTKEQWKTAKKGIEYQSQEEEAPVETIEEETLPNYEVDVDWSWMKSPIVKYVFLIIVIGILVLTIFYLFKSKNFANYKVRSDSISTALAEAERDLEKADFSDLLQQYIKEKDYRTAVRVLYLITIQNLHQKGRITWKKEKTNRHFLNEMRNDPSFVSFKQLTYTYEVVWYGDHAPDEAIFTKIYNSYNSFNASIAK